MRIFKILLISASLISGQELDTFLLDSLLLHHGEFGGSIMVLNGNNSLVVDQQKSIDKLFFARNINMRDPVLQKMFSPLQDATSINTADATVKSLRSAYSFLPENIQLDYGFIDPDQLGAKIYFVPQFSNYFSGIIGAGSQDQEQWQISGELDIHLENLWKTASTTSLIWKRQFVRDQYLFFNHEEPFIFGLPFGVKMEIIQDLRDEKYLRIQQSGYISVNEWLGGKWYFGGGKESIQPAGASDSLGITEYNAQSFNLGYFHDSRNDRWLPEKGLFVLAKYNLGMFDAQPNSGTLTAQWDVNSEVFLKFSERSAIKFKIWNADVWQESGTLHEGKWIRYGGLNTLRGYNADFLKAAQVTIVSLDYLLRPNKYMQWLAFIDHSVNSDHTAMGIGIKQKTQNNFIELDLGWPLNESFSAGKVHVKFSSILN